MSGENPPKKPARPAAEHPPVAPPAASQPPAGKPPPAGNLSAAGQPPTGKQPAAGKPPARRPPVAQPLASQPPAGFAPPAGQPPSRRRPAVQAPAAGGPAAESPPPAGPPAAGKPPVSRPTAESSSAGGQPPTTQKGAPAPPPVQEYLYDAFISYRHVDPDRQWAKWLHTALETYRVPQRLRRQGRLPARLKKVFRDEEELPASADLNKEIEKALLLSRFLIVICSPRTPESEWVNKEVVRFRQMKRDARILALLIDGEPGQSFPRALREIRRKLIDAQGNARLAIEHVEPLAADVRPARTDESPRHLKRAAKLRMLACILGVSFDDLRRRDRERFVRRAIATTAGLGVLIFAMTALSLMAIIERGRAKEANLLAENRQQLLKDQIALTEQQEALAKQQTELADEQKKLADQKEKEAERHNLLKRREIYVGNMKSAWNAWQRNAISEMAAELDKYDPRRAPEDAKLRGFEWYFLKMLPKEGCRTFDFGGLVRSVQFSPNGERVAAVGVENQHCIKVWALPDGHLERTLNLAAVTNLKPMDEPSAFRSPSQPLAGSQGVAYSPDGRFIAGTCLLQRKGDREGIVKVWDAETGREVLSASDNGISGHSIAFSPDSKYVVAGGYSWGAFVWSLDDGKLAWTLPSFKDPFSPSKFNQTKDIVRPGATAGTRPPVATLFFSAGGTMLTRGAPQTKTWQGARKERGQVTSGWTSNDDEQTESLRVTSGKPLEERGTWRDRAVAYSPDGKWALAPDENTETVRLVAFDEKGGLRGRIVQVRGLDRHENYEPARFSVQNGPIDCAAICNRYVAVANGKGVVELGQIEPNSRSVGDRLPLRGHWGDITCLAFSADQQQLAAAGHSSVVVWSTQDAPERVLLERGEPAMPLGLGTPHGEAFFARARPQGQPATISIVDGATGAVVTRFETAVHTASALAASPDRTCCAIADKYYKVTNKGDILLFDSRLGGQPRWLQGHTGEVSSLKFDRDGKRLLSASHDGTVRIWDVIGARQMLLIDHREQFVTGAVFAGDGRWIVARDPAKLAVWGAESGEAWLSIQRAGIHDWTCSADGLLLAACASSQDDGAILRFETEIWDIEKKERKLTIVTGSSAYGLAFSADASELFGLGDEGVVVWSTESGEDVFTLPIGIGAPQKLAARIPRLEQHWRSLLDPPTQ